MATTDTQSLATQASFEERMTSRMRELIGSSMTDEELKELIRRGVERFLFEKRVTRSTDNWRSEEVKMPLIQEIIEKHLSGAIQTATQAWINENSERLIAAVKETLQHQACDLIVESLNNRLSSALFSMQTQLVEALQKKQF